MANNQQNKQVFSSEVIEAIKSRRKLQAIKLLRNETGLGLKEAKEAVEAYIETNAELKEVMNASKTGGLSQENIVHIIILLIVVFVIYKTI